MDSPIHSGVVFGYGLTMLRVLISCSAALVLVAFALFTPSDSRAKDSEMTLSGEDFLKACTRPDKHWISFCDGYVQAVFDGVGRTEEMICPPIGFTRAKIVGLVVSHLRKTPDSQNLNAASVVHGVLLKNFPCR